MEKHRLEEVGALNDLWSRILPSHLAQMLIHVACDMGEK